MIQSDLPSIYCLGCMVNTFYMIPHCGTGIGDDLPLIGTLRTYDHDGEDDGEDDAR